MSHDDPTPERLDAILDGREPATTDREREIVDLAAALREASPRAGGELRARVLALGAPRRTGRLGRLAAGGWRGRALIAAPALAAIATAVIAVGVLGGDGPSDRGARSGTSLHVTSGPIESTGGAGPESPGLPHSETPVPGAGTTAPAASAPIAITVPVPADAMGARVAEARRIISAAGGTILAETPVETPQPGVALAATLPVGPAADAIDKLAALASRPQRLETFDAAGEPGPVRIEVLVVQAP